MSSLGHAPPSRPSPLALWAAMGALALTLFLSFHHWRILIPTNWGWLLKGDWGAGIIGWNAFRNDDWRWPLGETRLLAWPSGTTETYTDSNALVALLLKPFSGVLPEPFQFVGLWLLLCLVLQLVVAHALLKHATRDPWLRLLGAALFALVPTFIARTPHSNLCSHWTILLALHLYLNVGRDSRRDLGFAGLLALSGLIHPYFVLMNGCVWGSDLLRRSVGFLRRHEFRRFAVLTVRNLGLAAAVLAVLAIAGVIGSGYRHGELGFGLYSMPLDGLFNPARPDYSRFLPPAPEAASQLFEGFQYLGAGILFLVGVAGCLALVTPQGRARLRRMTWLWWLVPALVFLTLMALSDQVQLHGRVVARLDFSWAPFDFPAAFRASGRLFWPCTYVLLLAALEMVFALPRTLAAGVGAIALLVQGIDLIDFAKVNRGWTAEADHPYQWRKAWSPEWDRLIAAAELVEFEPPDPHYDDALFYEIAWRASSLKRPVGIMYTARVRPAQAAAEARARERFLTGDLDPKRLYVVMDGCAPPNAPLGRLRRLDQVMVITPAGADRLLPTEPALPPEPLPMARAVSLSAAPSCLLGSGWSKPEPWGVWSDGEGGELLLRLAGPPAGDLLLTVTARPFPEHQGVTVLAGGRRLGHWSVKGQDQTYRARIPQAQAADGIVRLTLKPDRPISPEELGVAHDGRKLGIGLVSLRLDPAR